MSTSVWLRARENKLWALGGGGLFLIMAAISVPNLLRSRVSAEMAARYSTQRRLFENAKTATQSESLTLASVAMNQDASAGTVSADRKMVRTSSLEMTVASPIEAAGKIRGLTTSLGGYVESSELNAQDAPARR